jgi:hypothetical protein
LKILVLGETVFLGRHLVEAASPAVIPLESEAELLRHWHGERG